MNINKEIDKGLDLVKETNQRVGPPDDITGSGWADKFRVVSKESSANPGKWKTLPYQKEPLDVATDSEYREVVIMAASQMLKTEVILNAIGYFSHIEPSPILVVQSTEKPMAESFSKERVAPMIRDTPVLSDLFGDRRQRDSDNTIFHKNFPGGFLAIAGSNSPGSLALRAIRLLLLDELNRFSLTAGNEGSPDMIAEARTRTFDNRKIIKSSSPTTKHGLISIAYESSDKRVYKIPCPRCNDFQILYWKNIRFNKLDLDIPAVCICTKCSYKIDESYKLDMLEDGFWHKRAQSKVAGFWISELYSVYRSWNEIANDFIKATNDPDPEKLRVVINTSFAESFQSKEESIPDFLHLLARREKFKRGIVPEGGLFLTASADVQIDRIEVEIRAWSRFESWSIDVIVFEGEPSSPNKIAKFLNPLLANRWPVQGSDVSLKILGMGIDTGGSFTQAVYMWCRSQDSARVFALKGMDSSTMDLPVRRPKFVDISFDGQIYKDGLQLRMVGVSLLKGELYAQLKLKKLEDENFPFGFIHYSQFHNEEFFKQLTAEQKQIVGHRNGRPIFSWRKIHNRNEALDLAVYNRATAIILGIDHLTEDDWQTLEKNLIDTPVSKELSSQSGASRRTVSRGYQYD